ncbi:MAG: N-acetyltransferase [Oceanospirillaceae bacterium]|nr:N-acetyltransferase [Oceanospirillaceae bacterium]
MKFNDHNVRIGKNVQLGKNVRIGDNTIIYDNVIIGDNTTICNDCVIGEPNASYYKTSDYENPETKLGAGSLIRSHSIIYAGSNFGDNLNTGHRVTIRESTQVGDNCMIGSYCDIQGDCEIGDYSRFHSYVNIGQKSKIGNFVFIYPFVVLTNDPTPPSNELIGPKVDDYSQITTGAILLPGAEIGKFCMVAANSTVGGKFADDSFISGSPAKNVGKLSKMPFFNTEKLRHYPWPNNFTRNMPWEDLGFDEWNKQNP